MGIPVVSPAMKKVFGTRNERMVKRYLKVVDRVSEYEEQTRQLSDRELRDKTDEFRSRIEQGESAYDMIPEVFAIAREAMDRAVGIRNVFNPEHAELFDPSRLSASARAAYDRVLEEIQSTDPAEPVGEFLGCSDSIPSWMFVDIPNELYNAVRELYPQSKPPFRARPFDVQIIGAVVLYEGKIAEMKTGEGKTIVAPLATYLAVVEGKQVHVVTVNDYLVQRDRDWTFPFFRLLGMTVGAIHPQHAQPPQMKKASYDCNVVYGTTSEFGFDYLRDNMKMSTKDQVQKRRDFAIVDEVDSTLIDEARTPLIISGMAHAHHPRYELANDLALYLVEQQKPWSQADQKVQSCLAKIAGLEGDIRNARDKSAIPTMKQQMEQAKQQLPVLEEERDRYTQFYEVEMDKKRASLTHDGIAEAQKKAGVGSFYVGENIDLPHLLEQAIRAHSVYQRDRDYVVAPDKPGGDPTVIIVDQNTGRKMIGRQWSDGLHQAIEAKEGVKIKEETQTMATVTIQNFFKMYGKLAGMTGTADTEATEFHEIYKLDVICIPTNVPVERVDRNDLVFLSEKDKWDAIVDEIKTFHDVGRPILVGTTSVEKSELLSEMLTRKHNIKHEVLNAKQHEREADIIARAGTLGAVMIATNMAGRGTDIKLGRITPKELIEHWQRRNIAPRDINPESNESEIVAACYRHIAPRELELRKGEVEQMSDEEIEIALLRHWALEHTYLSERKVESASPQELREALDDSGRMVIHRLRLFENIEDLGGLHVIGTERHEARRIDNQLRGRSGRQGDNGSSRFFLSMEDDLMKMFAGETTLKVLSKLGMKEGDAIEAGMLNRAVERAQRKVEERNFLSRKNLLEYDEIMDVQRTDFYGRRQEVLEGFGVKEMIFDQIEDAISDAANTYFAPDYTVNCMAEWIRETIGVSIEPDRLRAKDREDLHKRIRLDAKEDSAAQIRVTLPEFLPEEGDPADWDYQGLIDWANARFKTKQRISEIREMSRDQIIETLEKAGDEMIDSVDLAPLDQYLTLNYAEREYAQWANNKFETEFKPDDFVKIEEIEPKIQMVADRAREMYRKREVTYPVDFALDMTASQLQQNPESAFEQLANWANVKYGLDWTAQSIAARKPNEIRNDLIAAAESWTDERIAARAKEAATACDSPQALDAWLREHYRSQLNEEDFDEAKTDLATVAERRIREIMRSEMTQFERWILLQIFDQAWKDHLHSMDQVRDAIGFRSFSQKDPRIEYKREGSRLFDEMQVTVRDKVTDLVFKARLSPARPPQPPPQGQARHPRPGSGPAGEAAPAHRSPGPAQPATAAAAAMAQQHEADEQAAESAGSAPARRKRQPRQVGVTVGRNEPCPCGSGKKYKQCCGRK